MEEGALDFKAYRLGLFYAVIAKNGGWFRIADTGLSWTREPPLFGERMGFRLPLVKFGQWRLFVLRK